MNEIKHLSRVTAWSQPSWIIPVKNGEAFRHRDRVSNSHKKKALILDLYLILISAQARMQNYFFLLSFSSVFVYELPVYCPASLSGTALTKTFCFITVSSI